MLKLWVLSWWKKLTVIYPFLVLYQDFTGSSSFIRIISYRKFLLFHFVSPTYFFAVSGILVCYTWFIYVILHLVGCSFYICRVWTSPFQTVFCDLGQVNFCEFLWMLKKTLLMSFTFPSMSSIEDKTYEQSSLFISNAMACFFNEFFLILVYSVQRW